MSRNPYYIKLIHSKHWRELRLRKLRDCPLCERCRKEGLVVPATEIHHITPVESVSGEAQMEALMFQYSNLMSLCHCCHSDIHRQMFSHSKEAVKENQRRATESFVNKFLK